MKTKKISKFMFAACNLCVVFISLVAILYPITSLLLINSEARIIFNTVNKDYEAIFGMKYQHTDSYFTDIACIKMEISTNIITKSSILKNEYLQFINIETAVDKSNSVFNSEENQNEFEIFSSSLMQLQDYNKAITYSKFSIPLYKTCESLYSALNYMTYVSDALLLDVINFIDNQESLSLAADKDTQIIRIMAKISKDSYLNLNQQILLYNLILITGVFVLSGTCLNIYRIRARKNKYRRKRKIKN